MKETKKIHITPEQKVLLRKQLQERMRIRRQKAEDRKKYYFK